MNVFSEQNYEQHFLTFGSYFCIRSKKGINPQMVYLTFHYKKKQYKISIGAKVYPYQWNGGKLISANLLDLHNNEILLYQISQYKQKFMLLKDYLCNNLSVNIDELINQIFYIDKKRRIMTKKTEKSLTFQLALVNEHGQTKDKTKHQYHTIISHFQKYLEAKKIPNRIEAAANYNTLVDYQTYMLSNGASRPTINNRISVLQMFLSCMNDDRIDIAKIKTLKKLKDKQDLKDKKYVVLTVEQIKDIFSHDKDNYNIEFTDMEKLVRDIFVLECLCGQRIEDIYDLIKTNDYQMKDIQSIPFITHVTQKTQTECLIPLLLFDIDTKELLKRIVESKELKLMKNVVYTTHKVDGIIKDIMKRLGYNNTIEWKEIDNHNEMVNKKDYFYNLVTSHTGRRSFITNCTLLGLADSTIKSFSGHKSDSMLNRYKKLTIEDKSNLAANDINKLKGKSKTNEDNSDYSHLMNEAKKVLAFLGADAAEILDLNDIDNVYRTLYGKYEHGLIEKGVPLQKIKEIYNDNQIIRMQDKRKALKKLINDIRKK